VKKMCGKIRTFNALDCIVYHDFLILLLS